MQARNIKIISFDVDGTLVSKEFVDAVWLQGIPEAYASKEGISIEKAKEIVRCEYDKVGEEAIEWYELDYWLRMFCLDISQEELFKRFRDKVKLYPEVKEVLERLKKDGYVLIISSNATKPFINFQISTIKYFFAHIFSATSDFYEVKKSDAFYVRICKILNVKPSEVVHTGDHFLFDFFNPRKIGMNAYHLDREKRDEKRSKKFVISDLKEFLGIVEA